MRKEQEELGYEAENEPDLNKGWKTFQAENNWFTSQPIYLHMNLLLKKKKKYSYFFFIRTVPDVSKKLTSFLLEQPTPSWLSFHRNTFGAWCPLLGILKFSWSAPAWPLGIQFDGSATILSPPQICLRFYLYAIKFQVGLLFV